MPCRGCGAVNWHSPLDKDPRCPECKPAKCEQCEATAGVEYEGSRTAYAVPSVNAWQRLLLDDEGLTRELPDPNTGMWLCRDCAKDYQDYWDEMWENARQG